MIMPISATYRPARAPQEHGQVFVEPPFPDVAAVVESNRRQADASNCDIHGVSLSQLTAEAREDLVAQAKQYTSAYRDVRDDAADDAPLILAGHQPQLFHAGVWIKNFALSSLARQVDGRSINLLIDNDILRNPAIRVPVGCGSEMHVSTIAFDRAGEPIPYEQREIVDERQFQAFGHRVTEAITPAINSPLIDDYWPLVLEAAQRSRNVGRCLAEARHRLEGQWGQNTWEVPLSTVCNSRPFAWFTAHLLANMPRLHEVYNTSLAEYREINRIRSRSHPVPDLAVEGQWLEAPFWLWTTDAPRRRRLFVRSCGEGLKLSDRGNTRIHLPLTADRDPDQAVQRITDLANEGIYLRPRALTTTLYARLLLSDMFVHGIGGAKYDQLTDLILHRFFGVQPPEFMTLSATVLLLEDRTQSMLEEIRETRQLLREFRFHPERHLAQSPEIDALVKEKLAWIAQDLPRGQRGQRHTQIDRVNLALQAHLAERSRKLSGELTEANARLRQHQPLASREFSFCLFSEATLRPLLLELSASEA